MKKFFRYFKNHKLRLLFGCTLKVIGTVAELFIPFILSYILDQVIPNIGESKDLTMVFVFGGLMILISASAFILNVKANQMAAKLSSMVTQKQRDELFDKVEHLSAKQVDEVTVPTLISRCSTDTYNLYQCLNVIQRIGLRAPILFVGGLIMCLLMDYRLTLVFVVVLPFIALIIFLITKFGLPIFNKIQLAIDDLVKSTQECISGIRVIKAMGKEEEEKSRFQKVNKKVYDYEFKTGILMAGMNPSINLFLNLGLVLVILMGAYLVNEGLSSVGKIIAFISYFTLISQSMIVLGRIFQNLSKGLASINRMDYLMNIPSDLAIEDKQEVSKSFIEFKNVSFAYNENKTILHNINFTLEEGETLGIIGPTGSGKSTICSLLLRFYDCQEGDIFVNHKNVKSIDEKELKSYFGTVFQSDLLFNDTVRENIDFGRKFDDILIWNALKEAQAESFIKEKDEGLDLMVAAKGNNFSGGQKQRLLIARALVGNPKILVLDDAFSALDYQTDATLRNELKKYENQSRIIVSQRISSIKDCTKIMVIEKGNIISLGTHEELIKNSQIYQEIASSQLGGDFDA